MKKYHKIQTVFKRDPATRNKTLLMGEYSMPEFRYLSENEWVFTEKVDGTNVRVLYQNGKITFSGKSDNAQLHVKLLECLNDLFLPRVKNFEQIFGFANVCLYGEGYGPKIQSGGKYTDQHDFVLFDVKVGNWWLERNNVEDIAGKLDIEYVPIIGNGTLPDMIECVQAGFNSQWGEFIAEGIVARPAVELTSRNGSRIITKIKYKDFPK